MQHLWTEILPSQISQKSIHVGRDLYLLKFTDCDPPWKGFLSSDVHKFNPPPGKDA
jgi:hypothetical protein